MTNGAQIHGFYEKVILRKFGDLLSGWKLATNAKFQPKSPKLPQQGQKKHQGLGCEYTVSAYQTILFDQTIFLNMMFT